MSTVFVDASAEVKRRPAPLPTTSGELVRKNLAHRTVNDEVESMFMPLYQENERFRILLEAVYDSEAQEGCLRADDYEAARHLREYAETKMPGSRVAGSNLETLRRALNTVLRRFSISRNERRGTVQD